MIDPLLPENDGQTPLSEEEREGLIPSYITLRAELNEAEQANILAAEEWAFKRAHNVLDIDFLYELHKRMFGRVWTWAGTSRTTGKNIGVDAYRIRTDLQELIKDGTYWIENGTYEPDEIAVRFHHRLVHIHPYPNGNGRHARLATDLLLRTLDQPRFTWGSQNLTDPGQTRTLYIEALRAADNHDYRLLLAFVRS
ncbi:MAG: mobile mystery protein B [Gammaproteobacteria bacterium]|nr:cell filamentation protein Fic [Chromatiales bacterium]MDP6675174.1 mobile mystery protein B [Gammaproteobacteria bacterium]